MIGLLTDFGGEGPYVGEMLAVLAREAPAIPAVSLMWDLPRFRPHLAAYLVAALAAQQPERSVLVAVVDPGVGTAARRPVWLEADGRVLVGPDNGLLDVAARRAGGARMHEILWRPRRLSASFHGRDLFAPAAARLATGQRLRGRALRRRFEWSRRWPQDLDRVVYVDGFGNCVTGRRAGAVPRRAQLVAGGRSLARARTFAAVPRGAAFWYQNSMGLVEIACNQDRACDRLGLEPGSAVAFELSRRASRASGR